MNDVTMQNCASSSIWARGVNLAVDGLSVQQIVDLDGVTGEIINLVGESVEISNLNGFRLSNIELESVGGHFYTIYTESNDLSPLEMVEKLKIILNN